MRKNIFVLALAVIPLFTEPALAQQQCASITNAKKRLACYDIAKDAEKDAALREQAAKKNAEIDAVLREQTTKKNAESQAIKEAIVEANKTLASLRRMENRIEVGVSYRDYPSVLADASNAVREFHDSKHSAYMPELDRLFLKVDKQYRDALFLWQDKFDHGRVYDSPALIGQTKRVYESLVSTYPELTRAVFVDSGFMGSGVQHLAYGRGLSILWGMSSSDLRCASEWAKKIDGDKLPDKLLCMLTDTQTGDSTPTLSPSQKEKWVATMAEKNGCEGAIRVNFKNKDGIREVFEAICVNKMLEFTCEFSGPVTEGMGGIPFVAVTGKSYQTQPACWR